MLASLPAGVQRSPRHSNSRSGQFNSFPSPKPCVRKVFCLWSGLPSCWCCRVSFAPVPPPSPVPPFHPSSVLFSSRLDILSTTPTPRVEASRAFHHPSVGRSVPSKSCAVLFVLSVLSPQFKVPGLGLGPVPRAVSPRPATLLPVFLCSCPPPWQAKPSPILSCLGTAAARPSRFRLPNSQPSSPSPDIALCRPSRPLPIAHDAGARWQSAQVAWLLALALLTTTTPEPSVPPVLDESRSSCHDFASRAPVTAPGSRARFRGARNSARHSRIESTQPQARKPSSQPASLDSNTSIPTARHGDDEAAASRRPRVHHHRTNGRSRRQQ